MTDTPDDAGTVSATAPPGGTATAITTPAACTVKTVEHEEASRLPDTSWLWRRVLIFAVTFACLFFSWRISESLIRRDPPDIGTLRQLNGYNYGMMFLGLTLYGVGATITDVAKLIASFLSTKRITETSTPTPTP